ncbi:MAG: peptide-methionine (R)-S-oxide reductase [Micavibrio aeruginosavorus]|uniref:peptide-methionine (R)-S-oxide reductase n=1 Tax=Micavibrio aeruginosavorus TaxID=349221 RepID=A0A2W5FSA9_9BACT|nr:MAG: peptide-methionine (R)-S-oxide reductase [Micavibrio aeruginosavorus]
MKRRDLLKFMGASGCIMIFSSMGFASQDKFPVTLSDDEWKKKLSPDAYNVLRRHATEMPFTSPLNEEYRKGLFKCGGCNSDLFSSNAKFNSHTGWPSFFQPVAARAIGTTTDRKLLMERVEVHCATCGGHLGHVFEDGPDPTGLRYCINGVALAFAPL